MSVLVKKSPTRVTICCRNGDPFQGPKLGSCLTLGNELSKETHVLTKQEILLEKGTGGREQQGKGNQENCSATWLARSLGFCGNGIRFWVVFGQSF